MISEENKSQHIVNISNWINMKIKHIEIYKVQLKKCIEWNMQFEVLILKKESRNQRYKLPP